MGTKVTTEKPAGAGVLSDPVSQTTSRGFEHLLIPECTNMDSLASEKKPIFKSEN